MIRPFDPISRAVPARATAGWADKTAGRRVAAAPDGRYIAGVASGLHTPPPGRTKEIYMTVTPTAFALTGFIAWTLALLVLMEGIRSALVARKVVPANGFNPENSNLSPFMQRLARAHANCLEGLPLFGGLMLVALVTGRSAVTDPLAMVLLGARIVQSCIHLASLSPTAVTLRFSAFAVQMGIGVWWAWRLLTA
jgi:uncharacterized MAPEG superfamily protein